MSTNIGPLCLHPQSAPNEPVSLHEGPVTLHHDRGPTHGTGALVLRWFPTTGLRLECLECDGTLPKVGSQVKAAIADSFADVRISSVQQKVKEGVSASRSVGKVSPFETGDGGTLVSIGFQVVNFSNFLTSGRTRAPVFGFPPILADLEHAGWRVRLAAIEGSTKLFRSLDEAGGYAFTHLGRVERSDGTTFSARDAEEVLAALTRFLSFARGAACSLPVRWGVDARGVVVWQNWGSPIVDVWKDSQTWFDEHHGNLLSEIFPAFAALFLDPNLGTPFKLALHWYQSCNTRAGGMEGAIILGLTALDLLGALIVVDRTASMSDAKYDKLSATEKLAKLLQTIRVPPDIPVRQSNLTAFAASNGWADATVALTKIRHGYVHANRKRRGVVLSASNLATFEAWQLALWYQELALLYVLNHHGEYQNRLSVEWVGTVEKVPWA